MNENKSSAARGLNATNPRGSLPRTVGEVVTQPNDGQVPKGLVFDIQRFSTEDGPGIRTTVFLKGCPLTCMWCSNPESQRNQPELAYNDSLCNRCGDCVPVCDQKAIVVTDAGARVNRELCNDCGACVDVCTPRALCIMGSAITVDEVFEEIERDKDFYQNSDGGVTCSGGEPLAQAKFVSALFCRCKQAGIHTTLDTCGFAPTWALEKVLAHTDLVLFDIKLIDNQAHLKATGVQNQQILENARHVADSGVEMILRVPLIPGITDTDDNITAIALFVKSLRRDLTVNVLPYHRFSRNKYQMLDLAYPMGSAKPLPEERIKDIVERFGAFDLPCEIVA